MGNQIDPVPGIMQEALVRGLKLHITLLVPPCPKMSIWALKYDYEIPTTFPDRVDG